MAYIILLPTYMLVAIAGYWAYGFSVSPQLLTPAIGLNTDVPGFACKPHWYSRCTPVLALDSSFAVGPQLADIIFLLADG